MTVNTRLNNDSTTSYAYGGTSIYLNTANTQVSVYTPEHADKDSNGKGDPHPELIFSFVKSKMTKVQQKALLYRTERLRHIMQVCLETGQKALADEMLLELAGTLSLQEIAACGYTTTIQRSDIEKYVKDKDSKVAFTLLEKFPRPIPPQVRKEIAKAQKLKLFSELWVLYHNPDKKELKSTLDKIVAKDPILFGKGPSIDQFFFITDWMDEACDLTIDGLVRHLSRVDPSYSPGEIGPITFVESEAIWKRAQAKLDSLGNTNRGTWKTEATVEHLKEHKLPWKERFRILRALLGGGR